MRSSNRRATVVTSSLLSHSDTTTTTHKNRLPGPCKRKTHVSIITLVRFSLFPRRIRWVRDDRRTQQRRFVYSLQNAKKSNTKHDRNLYDDDVCVRVCEYDLLFYACPSHLLSRENVPPQPPSGSLTPANRSSWDFRSRLVHAHAHSHSTHIHTHSHDARTRHTVDEPCKRTRTLHLSLVPSSFFYCG